MAVARSSLPQSRSRSERETVTAVWRAELLHRKLEREREGEERGRERVREGERKRKPRERWRIKLLKP